jgi:Multiubiquitin
MSTSQTAEKPKPAKKVSVRVNNKKVDLPSADVTGLQIKEAAIEQGVEIELDFILTLEPHDGEEARTIGDEEPIHVEKHWHFSANDGDDDS